MNVYAVDAKSLLSDNSNAVKLYYLVSHAFNSISTLCTRVSAATESDWLKLISVLGYLRVMKDRSLVVQPSELLMTPSLPEEWQCLLEAH